MVFNDYYKVNKKHYTKVHWQYDVIASSSMSKPLEYYSALTTLTHRLVATLTHYSGGGAPAQGGRAGRLQQNNWPSLP